MPLSFIGCRSPLLGFWPSSSSDLGEFFCTAGLIQTFQSGIAVIILRFYGCFNLPVQFSGLKSGMDANLGIHLALIG